MRIPCTQPPRFGQLTAHMPSRGRMPDRAGRCKPGTADAGIPNIPPIHRRTRRILISCTWDRHRTRQGTACRRRIRSPGMAQVRHHCGNPGILPWYGALELRTRSPGQRRLAAEQTANLVLAGPRILPVVRTVTMFPRNAGAVSATPCQKTAGNAPGVLPRPAVKRGNFSFQRQCAPETRPRTRTLPSKGEKPLFTRYLYRSWPIPLIL